MLYSGGDIVELTPKALEVLAVLVETPGKLVSKVELVERVWPGQYVDEANVPHYICLLRQAFGTKMQFIKTISKRGYIFVADVTLYYQEKSSIYERHP